MKIISVIILCVVLFTLPLLADIKCYPVPWIPDDGKLATGTWNDGITFMDLPNTGEILIYTTTGKFVEKIAFSNTTTQKWFGTDQNGDKVASGVYLWLVKGADTTKTGKLIVIR